MCKFEDNLSLLTHKGETKDGISSIPWRSRQRD
jgi:hypothetical protein